MADYLYTVLTAGIFVAVVLLLSPDGKNGKLGKYIAFIGSLTVAVVILLPLMNVLSSRTFAEEGANSQITEGGERSAEYYANAAGMVLSETYGVSLDDIRAEVKCNDEGEIKEIVLFAENEVIFDEKEAEKMLGNIFSLDIRVVRSE